MSEMKKAAVLGAGVMGSGIAAHLAGAGLEVMLLDIVLPGQPKNALAQGGLDKALKAKPAAFFSPRDAERITVGNFDDDLAAAARADLIIEAVKEDLAIKRALFGRLEPLLGEDSIVTSNTSGLPIAQLTEGRSAAFRKHFCVTHFFNPVRYMKLLELVSGPDTDPDVVKTLARFGTDVLGKGIVYGKDTPNFVANRIGVFSMMYLIKVALENEYTVEEVDAVFGQPLARPKSAVFRTADLVGLDTVVDVAQNCYRNLPNDERRADFQVPKVLLDMVERKLLGDKTGGGFFKKTDAGILTLDLKTLEYRPQQKAKFASTGAVKGESDPRKRVRTMLTAPDGDRGADLARRVSLAMLAYSSKRLGEIADDIVNIDRAMRWGFGWELGPFESWDALGVEDGLAQMAKLGIEPASWVREMVQAGRKSFYEEGTFWDPRKKAGSPIPLPLRSLALSLQRAKSGGVLFENDGATLYDLGDGVAGFEVHTKMNALDADVIAMLHKSLDEVERRFDALVVGNDATDAFSAGANLFLVVMAANQGNWKAIEEMTKALQDAHMRLLYSSKPTVTAPFGLTLGGGAELAMHGAQARAHAELYMGLVEAGVGLIPAGGGCKELVARACAELPDDADPFPLVKRIFLNVAMGKVSMSAEEARAMGMLSPRDQVTLHRDQLLFDAKEAAIGMARASYRAPRRRTFRLPGEGGYAAMRSSLMMMKEAHQISAHDVVVGSKLAYVLCGGGGPPTVRHTEQAILDLEREAFLALCGEEKSRERMQYMLMNGKPLRN